MLAQLISSSNLCPRRRARFFLCHTCRRMSRGPGCRVRRPGADLDHIGNRIPFAVELADLLLIYVKVERDLMIVLAGLCMHLRKVQRAARSRIQNAHQSSLRIAIANVKTVHACLPVTLFELLRRFLFQHHLRECCSRRNHRENVGLGRAIKHQQLRLRRPQESVD